MLVLFYSFNHPRNIDMGSPIQILLRIHPSRSFWKKFFDPFQIYSRIISRIRILIKVFISKLATSLIMITINSLPLLNKLFYSQFVRSRLFKDFLDITNKTFRYNLLSFCFFIFVYHRIKVHVHDDPKVFTITNNSPQ